MEQTGMDKFAEFMKRSGVSFPKAVAIAATSKPTMMFVYCVGPIDCWLRWMSEVDYLRQIVELASDPILENALPHVGVKGRDVCRVV